MTVHTAASLERCAWTIVPSCSPPRESTETRPPSVTTERSRHPFEVVLLLLHTAQDRAPPCSSRLCTETLHDPLFRGDPTPIPASVMKHCSPMETSDRVQAQLCSPPRRGVSYADLTSTHVGPYP